MCVQEIERSGTNIDSGWPSSFTTESNQILKKTQLNVVSIYVKVSHWLFWNHTAYDLYDILSCMIYVYCGILLNNTAAAKFSNFVWTASAQSPELQGPCGSTILTKIFLLLFIIRICNSVLTWNIFLFSKPFGCPPQLLFTLLKAGLGRQPIMEQGLWPFQGCGQNLPGWARRFVTGKGEVHFMKWEKYIVKRKEST